MLDVAIVGLGWWGRTILSLLANDGPPSRLRPVLLVDPDPSAAADLPAARGLPRAATLEQALADPRVRGVVLCTPHSLHADQIVAAARAGRHVFCEKPLALTAADVDRALAAVREAGVVLAVGHERRFETPVQALATRVDAGELGRPLQVEANFSQDKFLGLAADNWRLSASEAPAGPMTATGIHMLDLAVRFLGRPTHVFASVRTLDSPLVNGDTLAALVAFDGGPHALISAMLATPFVGRFALYGSRGWAEIVDRSHPEAPSGWTMTIQRRGAPVERRDYPPMSAVLANLDAFGTAAAGGAPYPVPPDQLRATVAALEAVVRSTRSGAVAQV